MEANAKTKLSYLSCGYDSLELRATVFCEECGCERSVVFDAMNVPFDSIYEALDSVIERWNRRVDDDGDRT